MIEYLSVENLEEALDFAQVSHGDSAWKEYAFDRDVLRARLHKQIGNPKHLTCIYRSDGRIVGYFFATLGKFLFSDKRLGMENGIYVLPAYRAGRAAAQLFRVYLKWCRAREAEPLLEIYFGNDSANEKVYGLLRKLGLTECGRAFRGGSAWGAEQRKK